MEQAIADFKVDKTGWGEGPWTTEPDREQWVHAGYACLVLRSPQAGHLCGYVGVPREHPAYGRQPIRVDADAHGGLNYASRCDGLICHVPEPGMPADVWWLGFDCGHTWDLAPARAARERERGWLPIPLPGGWRETYRTLAYVKREVESLAEQLRSQA